FSLCIDAALCLIDRPPGGSLLGHSRPRREREMTIPVRLHRSELCVPGTNVRMLEKAPGLGADVVMLDLEDAVAPDDKSQPRRNVIDALGELDWSGCTVTLRINGLDTHYCYRDIVDVVAQRGQVLDTLLI